MRGLRSFIALLVVALGFGAYLYFVESKRTPADDAEKFDKVFAVDADAIDEVTIRSDKGEQTTLKKTATEWQMAAPAEAPADAAEISGITTNLSTVEQQRLIDENPANLADFGLAEPRVEVAFKTGGQEQRLLIGSKTPTGSDLYAKTAAQPRVFLIPAFLESTFNRSTFDLRDKTALAVDREAADTIEIVTAVSTLQFKKANGDWQITQPAATRPDAAAIEGLLGRVSGLQMKKLEAAAPGSLASYGLEKPAATLRISGSGSPQELLIGSPAGEGEVYAKNAARPEVFTVEASLLDDLKKEAGEYRQKDLFDARAFNTTRIEVTRAGQTFVFDKSRGKNKDGQDADQWKQSSPAAKDLDAAKVGTLLSALTSARAESFVTAMPAGPTTEAAFTLTFDDGKQERVTFARAGSNAYGSRDGAIAKVDAAVIDGIVQALDALR